LLQPVQDLVGRQKATFSTVKSPINKTISIIEKEVFESQVALVKLAEECGADKKRLYKQQNILFRSLNYRILAVHKVSQLNGSQTPGCDGISLKTTTENGSVLTTLLEQCKEFAYHPNRYYVKPVKRVGKLRSPGIPVLIDRVMQCLLNLILEPLVESTSDAHSYGFRRYRSMKHAIAQARLNLKMENPGHDKMEFAPEDK
jgi:RNA-directed DNA polymerase